MYEDHFGLKSRPFGAKAEGKAVFVGPTQSKAVAALHKGLSLPDAVVTVTGPVGVGKTTIVTRALDSIPNNRMVALIGRMQLAPDELLELVLAGFGIGGKVKGTVRKIAAFRRLQRERSASGPRVAIVVEDALRLGVDALVELEALTAADSGDESSANIILMGQPGLDKFLRDPNLARMAQRRRNRLQVEPLTAAEVQGYLKHCIREAGGNYDLIFDKEVADLVYQCTGGIPRVINNVCEAAMIAAMDEHSAQVTAALLAQVAADTLGFDFDDATVESVAIVADEDVATAPVADEKSSVPRDCEEASNDASCSINEDVIESGDDSDVAPAVDVNDAQTSSEKTDIEDEIEPVATATASATSEIDWDAIAPPPLPRSEIRDANNGRSPKSDLTKKSGHQLDVESGMLPNIDAVISASKAEDDEERLAKVDSADPLTGKSEGAEASSDDRAAASDLGAVPDLINDTQPELRALPDPSDEPVLAKDLQTLPEAADAKDNPIPSSAQEIEAARGDAALAPENLAQAADTTQDHLNVESEDASVDLNSAQTVETESDELKPSISPNESEIAKAAPEATPTLGSDERSESGNVAERTKDLDTPEENTRAPTALPEGDANDAETDLSADLPTLSDSMRVGVLTDASSASEASATENSDPAAKESSLSLSAAKPEDVSTADLTVAPNLESDPIVDVSPVAQDEQNDLQRIQPDQIPSEPTENRPPLGPVLDAPNALSAAAEDEAILEEASGAGMFDELDPLPDLEDSQRQDAIDSDSSTITEADGAISVTNLTIANNFDKSKNDIDALEAALDAAKEGNTSAPPPIEQNVASELNGDVTTVDLSANDDDDTIDVPQITLDNELDKRKTPDVDLEKIAQEIGTADSLEDFSASMAETLFGNEAFEQIAAQVVANPPVSDGSPVALDNNDASPVQLDDNEMLAAANDTSDGNTSDADDTGHFELSLEPETSEPATVEPKAAATPEVATVEPKAAEMSAEHVDVIAESDGPAIGDSIAMRIDILNRAKNNVAGMAMENVELGESNLSTTADGLNSPKPESIENQINTSITQTLEALNVEKMAKMEQQQKEMEEEEENEKTRKKSGGLFARFRKSS